jgi:hypothetical protein
MFVGAKLFREGVESKELALIIFLVLVAKKFRSYNLVSGWLRAQGKYERVYRGEIFQKLWCRCKKSSLSCFKSTSGAVIRVRIR